MPWARSSAVANPSASFRYLYDFGDGWEHQVAVEKELRDVDRDILACIDGRRAYSSNKSGSTPARTADPNLSQDG